MNARYGFAPPRRFRSLLPSLALAASLATASFAQTAEEGGGFARAAEETRRRLEEGVAELAALRERAAAETLPLSRELAELENELLDARREYQDATRALDGSTLALTNLRTEIKARKEENAYLANLLGEYARQFETRLHIAEIARYRDAIRRAGDAREDGDPADAEALAAQTELVRVSMERLSDALGGARFAGTAVDAGGIVRAGTFALVGPVAIFAADEGGAVGVVEQRLGSLEPTIAPFGDPEDAAAAKSLAEGTGAVFPLDPTLGNARKIEKTEETLVEHIRKGGPVMYPILGLAGAALLVALLKWLGMVFVRVPSRSRLDAFLQAVSRGDLDSARSRLARMGGPVGRMLRAGMDNLDGPRELVEEAMYESMLAARLRLQRFLSFISISAAAAPLLGLLGTVTGIINTFKLITVFGSGDVQMLSGGISEALITTEYGLYVAIPSLLMHAFLSRKAKGILDAMEKTGVAFSNAIAKAEARRASPASPAPASPAPVADPVARREMDASERPEREPARRADEAETDETDEADAGEPELAGAAEGAR